jgi:hypothetical protein
LTRFLFRRFSGRHVRPSPFRAAWLALAVLCLPASAEPNIAQSVQDAIRGRGVQTELPATTEDAAPEDKWLSSPSGLGDVLLWGTVLVGAATIAFAMRDSLPALNRSRRLAAPLGDETRASTPDLMSAAQGEADELAERGRYAEAMHLLLLRALAEVRERLKVTFADSLTSREILRRAPLEPVARNAFAEIIGEVELTHFGDTLADRSDYFTCRGHFEALRRSLGAAGLR